MQIINLTFDHPDKIDPNKTKAVKNLISSQGKLESVLFSLNRTANILRSFTPNKEKHGYSLRILGLPYGILLWLWMFIVHFRIRKIIGKIGQQPVLIHAHKLTFEGIIAYYLARYFKIPYILTIRGNTDLRVIKHKRFYRPLYKRIIERSHWLVFLAPWTIKYLERYYPGEIFKDKCTLVPNIVNLHIGDGADSYKPNERFISVFHLTNLKGKNIKRIIKAFDLIFEEYPHLGLDIVGSGPDEYKLKSYVRESNFPDKYTLLGPIDNQELIQKLPDYLGFILPSYPETFGIVFIEALSAGIPIIYSMNSGIDGYFDSYKIGEKVNHKSVTEICNAIKKLFRDNRTYKSEIQRLEESGAFVIFSKNQVGKTYSQIIDKVIPLNP